MLAKRGSLQDDPTLLSVSTISILMGMNLHTLPFHKKSLYYDSKKQQIDEMAKVLVVKSSMKGNLLFHSLSLLFLSQELVHF